MVIKVHLIKSKKQQSSTNKPSSFYKTSQIKFQSLSLQQNNNHRLFRTRSSPKIIRYSNPWQLVSNEEINMLAERLDDRPEELYKMVRQNYQQKKRVQESDLLAKRMKFNKLAIIREQQQLPSNCYQKITNNNSNNKQFRSQLNRSLSTMMINNKNPIKSKLTTTKSHRLLLNKSNNNNTAIGINNINSNNNKRRPYLQLTNNLNNNPTTPSSTHSLLQKINIKKLQYEKQMSSMIQNKRLILQTDLPKISKIRIVNHSDNSNSCDGYYEQSNNSMKFSGSNKNNSNKSIRGKVLELPVWRMR